MQRDDRSLWQRKFSNKNGGITLENLPDSNKILQFNEVEELAINLPSIIMTQESGNDAWYNRLFWWPVLIIPQNIPNTIYASKVVGEQIKV